MTAQKPVKNWREEVSKADRNFVYQRDKGVCQHCFEAVNRFAYDIDHITRVVDGGTGNVSNLILSHCSCNRRRGKRTVAQWRAVLRSEKQLLEIRPSGVSIAAPIRGVRQ